MPRSVALPLVLLLLLQLRISGAAANERTEGPEFLVRVWQSDEGLPGNVVRSLGQTPDGFLWIATAEGLTRFDGIEFELIPPREENRPWGPGFFRIFTPADGSVWLSTFANALYRVTDGVLHKVLNEDWTSDPLRISRLITHDGTVFFVQGERVWRIDGPAPEVVDPVDPALARALESDRVGHSRRGRRDDSPEPGELVDRDGGLWSVEGQALIYKPPGEDGQRLSIPDFHNQIEVSDMLEDREGNLWVASSVQGLVRIRHRRVTYLESDQGTYFQPVLTGFQASDDTWWLANRSGGVDRIRGGEKTFIQLFTSRMRSISCIFQDRADRLWFATTDASVFEWDLQERDFEARFTDFPQFSKVQAIAEDPQGRLWFGGINGLHRWDGNSSTPFGDEPQMAGVEIATLTIDDGGRLFGGTFDGRVFVHDGSRFTFLGNPNDLLGRPVSAVISAKPGEIWAATIGAGLFLWKDNFWHHFDSTDGLPDERLTALTLVDEDSLWLGSLGGILRVSRGELLQRTGDQELAPRWLTLDRSDGMVTRECIGRGQPGVFRDDDGKLWFPTASGLAGVDPSELVVNTIAPALHFRSVDIDGVPHPPGSAPIVTGPGRVRLGFHFTGVSLSAPEKVTYRVQLVGLDDRPQWIGNERRAVYQSVPPGRYVFEVSATNGDGVSTTMPAMLPIEVRPYFWQTAWFITLVVAGSLLLTLTAGWLVARRRMRRKFQELHLHGMLEAERWRISRDLHDDLGASLTEVSILAALAAEDNHDENLDRSLDQLSLKSKLAVGALDEIVWATSPSQDSLRSLVEYLAFFTREFLKAVQVPLHTEITHQVPDVTIGPRRRHNILLAAREAINNAVKHADPHSITLRIAIEDDRLVVVIRDQGKGFAIDYKAGGHGLTNLRQRMADCGGECRIESVRGEGTTIILVLPLASRPPHEPNPQN